MRHFVVLILALLSIAGAAFAQPSVTAGGILNHFSYARPGLPNGSIAQGSIFDIYGTNLGPAAIATSSGFPIPTVIAGTSVQVTVSGTTVDAYLFFVLTSQIVGVLPSRTPVGTGTLTVIVNGVRSAPSPITVVARSIGILTLNQAGTGAAAMQIPDGSGGVPLNSLTTTIRPGQTGVLYGTGAGAVTFDESRAAPFQDLGGDIRVFIGGREARMTFKGRTPGLVGLDQFNVEIPEGVSGCYVSVAFQSGNVLSNLTTISVAASGPCSDPITNQPPQTGILTVGAISLVRSEIRLPLGPSGTLDLISDAGAASFTSTDLSRVTPGPPSPAITIGSCTIVEIRNTDPAGPSVTTYLDAGPVMTLRGPNGVKQLDKNQFGFGAILGGTPIPGAPAGPPPYLDPGTYTADNGAGGVDVGPFTATLNVPAPIVWTNRDTITTIQRAQGVEITWTVGGNPNALVFMAGSSTIPRQGTQPASGYSFTCSERASVGRFTIPPLVLLYLPPSTIVAGVSTGSLLVTSTSEMANFTARGIQQGLFTFTSGVARNPVYQ